jgi:D-tagatose-1,6-bisphosphate aldolase subunit GatZ/KbaZ
MEHPVTSIIKKHKQLPAKGIYSICSANKYVLHAAMLRARKDNSFLLIEATSNQVDQYGGYTGMNPSDFNNYVYTIAHEAGIPQSSLILGGDHLGPNVWQSQPANKAMINAKDQIQAYISAGFSKIHLDASMPLGDDKCDNKTPLEAELVANRSADLCKVAETSYNNLNTTEGFEPVYVIGTDVPIPGGATDSLEDIRITPVGEVEEIISLTKEAFYMNGLEDAWQRVIGVVVQPGVEFSDDEISEYDPLKASSLSTYIKKNPQLVYEAHSTDYQPLNALRDMVRDSFAILKVGPWLTYAFREAIFSLTDIERELALYQKALKPSYLSRIIEEAMINNPKYWIKHYHGSESQKAYSRKYSYSDRIRYYWPQKSVNMALIKLMANLTEHAIPNGLLDQYMPAQLNAVGSGQIKNDPIEIIHHKIGEVLKIYSMATGMSKTNNITKN